MPFPRVKLRDIAEETGIVPEEARLYLDRHTGQVVMVADEFRPGPDEDAAGDENLPEWQRTERELARAVDRDQEGRFLPLPDRFDAHEWKMMDDFAAGLPDAEASSRLRSALRGRRAFRTFKDAVDRAGLADAWYRFRGERYLALAREWCEARGVEYDPS